MIPRLAALTLLAAAVTFSRAEPRQFTAFAPVAVPDVAGTLAGVAAAVRPTAAPAPVSGGQADLWPGYREHQCAGWHAGACDFCAPQGTPVYAPVSGTLIAVGSYNDTLRYGAYVIITTPGGLEVYVGHLDKATVNPHGITVGQRIEAGTPIGVLGPFVYSTPHAHVQLRRDGALVGPGEWWQVWEGRYKL